MKEERIAALGCGGPRGEIATPRDGDPRGKIVAPGYGGPKVEIASQNGISGAAAPQCGIPMEITSQNDLYEVATPQCGIPMEIVSQDGFSGAAAPQCGILENGIHPAKGWYSRGYLPHFDTSHAIQHITYRLADSLPSGALKQMEEEIEASIQDDDKRRTELRLRIETCLDAGHGSCILRIPEIAACVVDTWHRFDGERYRLLEWVVMPNHCHVMIEPFEDFPLGKIVLSWKNYTARFINEYKSRTGVRRPQEDLSRKDAYVWQREYWDRFIRDERHFEAARSYIAMNPVKAGLAASPEEWNWSSAYAKIQNVAEI